MQLGAFSRLPLELIFEIVRMLQISVPNSKMPKIADIFSLKATCRSFQIVIESDYTLWQPFVLSYLAKINRLSENLLVHAALKQYASLARFLIRKNQCDLDLPLSKDTNLTPLMKAAASGNLPILELLHQAGANLEACDAIGNTALKIAVFRGHLPVVEYLLKNKVNVNYPEVKNKCSLLKFAINWADWEDPNRAKRNLIIKALLEAGAVLNKNESDCCLVKIMA